MNFTFFFGPNNPNGEFSQFYKCSFTVDGIKFCCCEQFMMYSKAKLFGDNIIAEKILKEVEPKKIKALGRQVRNFDNDIWENNREQIVYKGNYAKFSQNESLKKKLLATGDSILAEASPYDCIWGIGLSKDDSRACNTNSWRGQNLLGYTLMKVRNEL